MRQFFCYDICLTNWLQESNEKAGIRITMKNDKKIEYVSSSDSEVRVISNSKRFAIEIDHIELMKY